MCAHANLVLFAGIIFLFNLGALMFLKSNLPGKIADGDLKIEKFFREGIWTALLIVNFMMGFAFLWINYTGG